MIDRVERLTNLLALLLETPQPLTLVQIAGELRGQYPEGEANRRAMFERDKAALRGIGVPIEAEVQSGENAGVSVYWIDRDRYELADLDLEPEETRALQAAFATIRSSSGGEIAAGEQALWKLGGRASDVAAPVTAHVPELSALPVLRDAAARRRTVAFDYHGTARHVDPYGLLLRNGFWYVLGREHEADQQRTYRVDRIEGVPTAAGDDDAFERPSGFDPRDQLPSDARRFGMFDDDSATAEVRISAERAVVIEREVGRDRVVRRNADRSIDLAVPCANVGAFGSWVLGLTDHAEVLGPPAIRAAIVERLSTLAAGNPPPRAKRVRR